MSWISIIWYMLAASAMTVAGIQLIIWSFSHESKSSQWFTIAAISASLMAFLELSLMFAKSPDAYAEILRWMHLTVALVIISIIWFIRSYLNAGRYWLAWSVVGIRLCILVVNFLFYPNATFAEVEGLKQLELWGEVFSMPVGQENPWRWMIHVSTLLFFAYIVDAAISAYKLGKKREALVFGCAVTLALLVSKIFSQLMVAGELPGPLITVVFMIFIVAMSFEMSMNLLLTTRLARELQQSEQRIRLAVEASNLSLWEWNIPKDELTILRTSQNQAVMQFPKQGRMDTYLELVAPADREQVRDSIAQAKESGVYESEFRLFRPDGETRWFSVNGAMEYDNNGEPLMLRGVFRDVSSLKKAEIELQQNRQELTHVSRVLTLNQLSFSLAHEINQPLGAILRNAEAAELLLQEMPLDLDELRAIIKDIREDDSRAAIVIERMRQQLKRRELDLQAIKVDKLIENSIEFIHAEAHFQNTDIRVELPDERLTVYGDEVHLQQVLTNLLLNSMEAYSAIEEGQRQIVIHVEKNADNMVEVSIIDRGSGIDEEQMPHMFKLFHTTKKEGIGIGLAISRTIIESHGGTIIVENNPDKGATVRLTLPIA